MRAFFLDFWLTKSPLNPIISELEKEQRNNSILKSVVEQSQELANENTTQINRDHKQRLETLKKQYGATINRHQGFIDQLIADKKTISEKCENLLKELRYYYGRRQKMCTPYLMKKHKAAFLIFFILDAYHLDKSLFQF